MLNKYNSYYNADRIYSIEENEKEIEKLLLYHKIVKVEGDKLYLDNGTVLEVYPNDGGGGCGSGDYQIAELNKCDNVITNVLFVRDDDVSLDPEINDTSYKIFVYAEDSMIKLLQVDGTDGNGYYGTGYEIAVKFSKSTKFDDLPEELKTLVELGIYTKEDAILQYVTIE